MKTRTLLMLAMACGLAIMLAGAVFLFQLSTQDDLAPPIEFGEQTRVGDMSVTIMAATERDGVLSVTIEIGGVSDDQPADEFRLIASGRAVSVADTTLCTGRIGPPGLPRELRRVSSRRGVAGAVLRTRRRPGALGAELSTSAPWVTRR